jgi:hypothetical protein
LPGGAQGPLRVTVERGANARRLLSCAVTAPASRGPHAMHLPTSMDVVYYFYLGFSNI